MDYGAALVGASLLPSIFGGGQVSVPGSMAKPTDPTKNILDDNSFVKERFQLGNYVDPTQKTAQGLLKNLQGIATQQGPTQSAQAMLAANEKESAIQRDQLNNAAASQRATAEANMAMKGGMGTGARERLNNSVANNMINQNAQINQQGSLNKLNTLAGDENMKMGLLKSLPSQFMDQARFNTGKREFDISNSINTANNAYNAQMGMYAGNQLTRQQAKSYNAANKGLLGGLF